MRIVDTLLNPNGRISRAGFWGGCLTLAVISALGIFSLLSLSDLLARQDGDLSMTRYGQTFADLSLRPMLIGLVLAVPVAWMGFCLMVKRWHDRGKSGWWLLIGLVPLIGNLWALVECGLLPGSVSGNKYGPTPLKSRALPSWSGDDIPEDMA